jgi:hypothetical protein
LNCHYSIHKDLIELGVDQHASHDFERVFKALSDYKAVHGDVLVPVKFLVANLIQIRVDGAYSEHRDRLEALGVNFEVKKIDVRSFDVVCAALEAYKAVHGNLFLLFLKVRLPLFHHLLIC